VLASGRRLAVVVSPARLDPALLLEAVRPPVSPREARDRPGERPDRRAGERPARRPEPAISFVHLRGELERSGGFPWEHDLFAAFDAPDASARVALASQELGEFEWLARRWERAPRVCASVATSAGFLFASVALLQGLALPDPDANAALLSGVDALSIGIAATSFCAAVHVRARRRVRERLAAVDRLVRVGLAEESGGPSPA
jgi:hypothetical protein